jgi:putative ubiquitin-RnfH superfamily antitoxin RatB of RatAB toxin-antitoxin module
MENAETLIDVSVTCALPDRQTVRYLELRRGATAAIAVRCSGLQVDFPEIDLDSAAIGIFGKIVDRDTVLEQGDRVEIYRPLRADPKESRRKRSAGR